MRKIGSLYIHIDPSVLRYYISLYRFCLRQPLINKIIMLLKKKSNPKLVVKAIY
jgi:hypothetical protein